MATLLPKQAQRKQDDDCGCPPDDDCAENTSLTQKAINLERKEYCDLLSQHAGEVSKWEMNYEGQKEVLEHKKCLFNWTEENYQRYRNTEITIGTELVLSGDLIKENVSRNIKSGAALAATLKEIFKAVKEAKTKMNDLREAACKLDSCLQDSCHCAQVTVLTGKVQEKCRESKPVPGERPAECQNIEEVLHDLLCMPKSLVSDIESIFKASADIIGIQVFSNIGTLDPLQKTLTEQSKTFEKQLAEAMKLREGDLKKLQEDLIKSIQEASKSVSTLYQKRSDFEGTFKTVKYLCCPKCGCVQEDKHCEPRLHQCEEEICGICEDVKKTFCTDGCNDPDPVPAVQAR
jgi:hypothetical protein